MTTGSNISPSIDVQDIKNLVALIDLAAQRGAFKGPELSHVGAVFDRITTALQNASQPKSYQPSVVTSSFFIPEIGNKNE